MRKSIIWAAAIVAVSACSPSPQQANDPSSSKANEEFAAAVAAKEEERKADTWSYDQQTDEMRGTTTKFARTSSIADVPVRPPYTPAPAGLTIRQRPDDGLSVLVTIEGQFWCQHYDGDKVAVKFDDQPIDHFRCAEPEGGGTGVLFIRSEQRFLTKLRAAKKVVIELPVYDAGNQQVTFNVEGLKWES